MSQTKTLRGLVADMRDGLGSDEWEKGVRYACRDIERLADYWEGQIPFFEALQEGQGEARAIRAICGTKEKQA